MSRAFRVRGIAMPALAALVALIAAACASSSSTTSSATTAAGPTTTGAPSCPMWAAGTPVKIGFFGALTGPNSPQLGVNAKNGVQLAIDEYNKTAPAANKVTLVPYDSQGEPAQAPQLAQRAITDKVIAIVGPTFSGESKVADPILEQACIPHVTESATNVALASNGWQYWYRALANDAAQGPADAQWIAKKVNAKTAAVIDDASDYGKGLADGVRAALKAANVNVAVSEAIDIKQQDFSSTVNKINAAKVDAVFYGGYYQDGGRFLKQLRDAGVKATFVSGDGSNDPKLVTTAGASAAEGAITTCACSTDSTGTAGQAFVSAYKSTFSTAPGTYSAEAFDVTNMLLGAIKGGATTPTALNTAIKSANYQGITKTLKFDAKGEVQGGQIYVYQVKNGTLTELGPLTSLVS